jgi:hypothetical protein
VAAGQGATDYIELSDFTPGIHANTFSTPSLEAAPDGAAQEDGTYGCYAGPRGGLWPLPRLVEIKTQALFDTVEARYPFSSPRAQILASTIISPLQGFDGLGVASPWAATTPDGLFLTFNWFYDDDGDGVMKSKMKVRYYKQFLETPTTFDLDYESGELTIYHPDFFGFYGYASFGTTRYNPEDPRQPGFPILAAHLHPFNPESGIVKIFPDQTDPFTDVWGETSFSDPTDNGFAGNFIICHQGRIIAVDNAQWASFLSFGNIFGYNFGASGTLPSSEAFQWTPVNDPLGTRVRIGSILVEENPTGYGSWVAMNANEVFFVKERGGGVVVRGDFERPTVIRYPGVPSTYGAANLGVVTDKGYVYGTRYGVWLWSGGDTAEQLSKQLEGWFWRVDDSSDLFLRIGQPRGQFNYSFPFLYAPNNWVLDMRTGGWFRLHPNLTLEPGGDDSLSYHSYHVSMNGNVYAVPGYIDSDQTTIWHRYDITIGGQYFQWKSQPLARTRNRMLKMREVVVMVQGQGSIACELIGTSASSDVKTITIDSPDRPIMRRFEVSVESHDVQLALYSLGSEGFDGDVAAPAVLRATVGFQETHSGSRGAAA